MSVRLNVNGRAHTGEWDPSTNLLSILRDDLHLTGTKYGCGEGACGSCTVLLDGRAVRACQTTAAQAAAARAITTIEGLEREDGTLHPVQQAFLDEAAFQCGYCTAGMIMGATALLEQKANPSPAEIRTSLAGHLCRCGTYNRIVAAVRLASRRKGESTDAAA